MVSTTFEKLLFGVAFLLGGTACAGPKFQYPDHAEATRSRVTVNVVWLPTFRDVHALCAFLIENEPKNGYVGCYDPVTNTIYAVQPANFNDKTRLEILGHEFWHALGAEHPEK